MKAIKLTPEQYQRSLKAGLNHLWLYSKSDITKRTHNNSIFLDRVVGLPFACLVVEYGKQFDDDDIQNVFGNGVFCENAVSPDDKENMNVDVYYIKGL